MPWVPSEACQTYIVMIEKIGLLPCDWTKIEAKITPGFLGISILGFNYYHTGFLALLCYTHRPRSWHKAWSLHSLTVWGEGKDVGRWMVACKWKSNTILATWNGRERSSKQVVVHCSSPSSSEHILEAGGSLRCDEESVNGFCTDVSNCWDLAGFSLSNGQLQDYSHWG